MFSEMVVKLLYAEKIWTLSLREGPARDFIIKTWRPLFCWKRQNGFSNITKNFILSLYFNYYCRLVIIKFYQTVNIIFIIKNYLKLFSSDKINNIKKFESLKYILHMLQGRNIRSTYSIISKTIHSNIETDFSSGSKGDENINLGASYHMIKNKITKP